MCLNFKNNKKIINFKSQFDLASQIKLRFEVYTLYWILPYKN